MRLLKSACALIGVAMLAGCADGGGETVETVNGVSTLTWAVQPGNSANLPLLLSGQNGALENNKVDLKTADLNGGNTNQIAALATGAADFFIAVPTLVASANERGESLRFFCGVVPQTDMPLMVRPDLNLRTFAETGDWTETVTQLEGLRIGVPARGSSYEIMTNAVLKTAGVDPSRVTYVAVGVGATALAAMETGDVDGLLSYGFLTQQLQDENLAVPIADASVDGPDSLHGLFSTGLVATESWIEQNADAAGALCESVRESSNWMDDPANRGAVAETLVADFGVPADKGNEYAGFFTDNYFGSEIGVESMDKLMKLLTDTGQLPASEAPTYDDLVVTVSRDN